MSDLRKLRIIFNYKGQNYKICKIMFTGRDSSLYIVPYSLNGKYYAGKRRMTDQQVSDSFNYREQFEFDKLPKLSIHQQGQIHLDIPNERLGPFKIPPIDQLRGQHVATICLDNMRGIPVHTNPIKKNGTNRDYVIDIPDRIVNCRLAVYINGIEPKLDGDGFTCILPIERKTLDYIMYVGLKVISQSDIGSGTTSGISMITGWNPTLALEAQQDCSI